MVFRERKREGGILGFGLLPEIGLLKRSSEGRVKSMVEVKSERIINMIDRELVGLTSGEVEQILLNVGDHIKRLLGR